MVYTTTADSRIYNYPVFGKQVWEFWFPTRSYGHGYLHSHFYVQRIPGIYQRAIFDRKSLVYYR